VAFEPVDHAAIWERDRGICWICEDPVDPALAWPHPMSRTFDHVIPMSKGGPHVASNIAVAHNRCNKSKQDKILDRVPRSLASA
jgi:5-methylcytosine-specific restriction endonuclease McrA